jgi:hypothetical protein
MNEDADDEELFGGGTTRERVEQHLGNYMDELEMDLSHTRDPDEREWIFSELEHVREVYELARRDLPAALDRLVSDSQSHGWAGSLLVDLEDAGINISNHYTAPWLREDAEDDELFGTTTMANRIAKLLQAKQKVFTRVMGARGQVMRVDDGGYLVLRTRPGSTTRYSWPGVANDPEKYKLTGDPAEGRWYVDYAEDPWDTVK